MPKHRKAAASNYLPAAFSVAQSKPSDLSPDTYVPDVPSKFSFSPDGSRVDLFSRSRWLPLMYADYDVEIEYLRYHHRFFPNADRVQYLALIGLSVIPIILNQSTLASVLFGGMCSVLSALAIVDLAFPKCSDDGGIEHERANAHWHELLLSAMMVTSSIVLGLGARLLDRLCDRSRVTLTTISDDERHEICFSYILPYNFVVIGTGVLCGRPRVAATLLCVVVHIASKFIAAYTISTEKDRVVYMRLSADIVLLGLILVIHAAFEMGFRTAFEHYVAGHESKEKASRQKRITDGYLAQLLPPMLYSRVLSAETFEDGGGSVSCCIIALDVDQFIPPTATPDCTLECVERVSSLMSKFCSLSESTAVERILVTGDEFVATCNLIVPLLSHAMRIAVFGTKCRYTIVESGIPGRVAIHTGHIRGTVNREVHLRYDIAGVGVETTRALLGFCPINEVVASSQIVELLRERVEVEPTAHSFMHPHTGLCSAVWCVRDVVRQRLLPKASAAEDGVAVSTHHSDGSSTEDSLLSPVDSCAPEALPHQPVEVPTEPPPGDPLKRVRFGGCGEADGLGRRGTGIRRIAGEALIAEQESFIDFLERTKTETLISSRTRGLEIIKEWHGGIHFLDEQEEANYEPPFLLHYYTIGSVGLTVLLLFLDILLLVDLKGVRTSDLAGQITLFTLTGITASAALLTVFLHRGSLKISIFATKVLFSLLLLLCGAAVYFGVALTHPSIAANDPTFVFVVEATLFPFFSRAIAWRPAFLLFLATMTGSVIGSPFVHGGTQKYVGLAFILACTCQIGFLLRQRELTTRERFREIEVVTFASELEETEKETLESALSAAVPAPLVHLVVSHLSRDVDPQKGPSGSAVVLAIDRGIVLILRFHGIGHSGELSSSSILPGRLSTSYLRSSVISKTNLHLSLCAFKISAECELAVASLQRLTLFKLIGDEVIVGGPTNPSALHEAAGEAYTLIETIASCGSCSGGCVTCGAFFAVATCGAHQASFFMVGPAVREATQTIKASPNAFSFSPTFTESYPRSDAFME